MPYVVAFLGLVGTLQGVAWIHQGEQAGAKARVGVYLAPTGLLMLVSGLLWALVPGFLG